MDNLKQKFLAYKQIIFVASIATVLLFSLVYQYSSYHFFSATENAKIALKNGQRIVVELSKSAPPAANATTTAPAQIAANKPAEAADIAADKTKPKKEIAIIIGNLGNDEEVFKKLQKLSKNFTLAFSAYGKQSTKQSIAFSEEGYPVLAELPMESTVNREEGGRFAISAVNSDFKNQQNLDIITSIIPVAIGIITPQLEDFSDQDNFDSFLKMLLEKKLGIVFAGKAAQKIKTFASKTGLETAYPDIVIDEQATEPAIQAQLEALEVIAQEKGFAVGIARPYPITLQILDDWQEKLANKKIMLVPALASE